MKVGIAVAVAIVVVGLFFIFNDPFMAVDTLGGGGASAAASNNGSGLVAQDQVVGTGTEAKAGSTVSVNYTGRLQDGTVFDTSVGRTPFQFTLGGGQVIAGWDQGLQGMKVGGKRLLIIPPALGYGAVTYGPIPANSTLIFEVELLSVTPAGQ